MGSEDLATSTISSVSSDLGWPLVAIDSSPFFAAFSGLVAAGWAGSVQLALLFEGFAPNSPTFVPREVVGLAAFHAASAFVFYASAWMRGATASTLRA